MIAPLSIHRLGMTIAIAALAAGAGSLRVLAGGQTGTAAPGAHSTVQIEGIWKAAVPAKPMEGEFGGLDPIGVAAGARIQADCSINWIDPDDSARYCFASGTSLQYFLDRPHANIERARREWRKLTAHQGTAADRE